MAKQSSAQQKTVERVMHEFKHGELENRGGERIKNPKQAIAIALHEAGASNQESEKTNKRNLKQTKRKEATGLTARDAKEGTSKAALYAQAKQKNIPGRSKMNKGELARALGA